MRYLIAGLVALIAAGAVCADDVVTMPTANQLKAGEVDVAVYYLGLDFDDSNAPDNANVVQLNVGITDQIEVDVYRADVDNDKTAFVFTGYYKVLSESPTTPDVVVGVKNIFGTQTTNHPLLAKKSKDRSYFACASKTVFLSPAVPAPPLVRVHLGVGTKDYTLLGEPRHDGIFGGLQFLLRPEWGLVVQHDSQDFITGISFMPPGTGLTIKGGTFGKHWWAGVAYRKTLSL